MCQRGDATVFQQLEMVDSWLREVVACRNAALGRAICPFVAPALRRGTIHYAAVTGCRSPEDTVYVMDELVEQYFALEPGSGPDTRLKTLIAAFVDVDSNAAEDIVISAHGRIKATCTDRGLMVGEFAPNYQLPSTRDPALNVGEAPLPLLVLRRMLPSDWRFLQAEAEWMAAWACRFAGR
jgi:hypothetical protein